MKPLKQAAKKILSLTVGRAMTERIVDQYADKRDAAAYRLTEAGRESAQRLLGLKNRYRGERCVIIGNGPSLNSMDLSPLRDEYTFGLNRIYLLYERLGFATDFLVSVNRYVLEQCAGEIQALPGTKFISWPARALMPFDDDVIYIRSTLGPRFCTDLPSQGVWEGATVTYVAIQLAYYLGFEQVILIGVDHSFASKGPAHQLVTSTGDDPDHFDPSYFGAGFRWQLPDLDQSEVAYRLAKAHFESAGREIVDATVAGKLDVFPKVDYDAIFSARRAGGRSA